MNTPQTCRECGNRLRGRSDKKFCSDMCRNTHNNRLAAFQNNTIRNINHRLKKNRRILEDLCPNGKRRVLRHSMNDFDFDFFTHRRRNRAGRTCYFVYDMGYLEQDNNFILIVRNPENAEV